MKTLFNIELLAVIISFILIIRMLIFQKVILVSPNGTLLKSLRSGAYDIVVFGRISNEDIKQLDVCVESKSGSSLPVHSLFMPSTGQTNFRTFTRVASFRLLAKSGINVFIANLTKDKIMASRLLLKRLIFNQQINNILIGVAPKFNHVKFSFLLFLNIVSFFLLFMRHF